MAFQPAPDIAKVTTEYTSEGDTYVNVYHVKNDNGWTTPELENLVGLVYNWADASLVPIMTQDVSLTRIYARDLSTEFAAYAEHAGPFPVVGGVASPKLPGNVTAAVKWITALTGRSKRGRTFHIGLAESQVTGGFLTSGQQTAMSNAYDDLLQAIAADSEPLTLVVLQRVSDGVPLTEAVGEAILTFTIDLAIDSMRKRLPGRGN